MYYSTRAYKVCQVIRKKHHRNNNMESRKIVVNFFNLNLTQYYPNVLT